MEECHLSTNHIDNTKRKNFKKDHDVSGPFFRKAKVSENDQFQKIETFFLFNIDIFLKNYFQSGLLYPPI